jgi:hypothetical protein
MLGPLTSSYRPSGFVDDTKVRLRRCNGGLGLLVAAAHQLVERHGDGGGEVEAADARVGRQADCVGAIGLEDRPWQPRGFAAKDDHVTGLDVGLPDRLCGKPAEVPVALDRQALAKLLPAGDFGPAEVLPVVQSGAADPFFIDLERGRLDDPEHRIGRHAGPSDVAGVLRNLWLVEDDMGQRLRVWLH